MNANNTANVLTAIEIGLSLATRATEVFTQVKAAHETGEGITDEQLAVIRGDVDAARAQLVKTIAAMDDNPSMPVETTNTSSEGQDAS